MLRIGALVAGIVVLMAETTWADQLVKCTNHKGPANSTTWQYTIKGTDSRRLASDITIHMDGQTSLISSLSVAQYLAKSNQLFVMIDDASENRILEFSARPAYRWIWHKRFKRHLVEWHGKFVGTLTEISNGATVESTKLNCTITELQ